MHILCVCVCTDIVLKSLHILFALIILFVLFVYSSKGVVEYSFALFFSKLVSYTFLFWLPFYISNERELFILCKRIVAMCLI